MSYSFLYILWSTSIFKGFSQHHAPQHKLDWYLFKPFTDVGIVASTIMYAFYLNETLRSDQFCTVPIINIKRANLGSHAELKWLLDSCQIDQSSLIFADEVCFYVISSYWIDTNFIWYLDGKIDLIKKKLWRNMTWRDSSEGILFESVI